MTPRDDHKIMKCCVKPEMATFNFNFPLNVGEFIKYALIPVFNSFYQSIFLLQVPDNAYLTADTSSPALLYQDLSYKYADGFSVLSSIYWIKRKRQ